MTLRLLPLLLLVTSLQADVRLPHILSSHMVLQRNRPIHFWGWADPGEKVTVTLRSESASATAGKLGRWSLYLPPRTAGGPYTVRVQGNNTIVLNDVLIGDVWFASGQSNMEIPLQGYIGSAVIQNADEEIRKATRPNIRLLFVPHKASSYPLRNYPQGWTRCTPETAKTFSAVAYFFGVDVSKAEHVPVGIIDSTWGGTPIASWISMDGISSDAGLMPIFAEHTHMLDREAQLLENEAAERRAIAKAKAAGQPPPKFPWHPDVFSWMPAWLYNGMVAPALKFPITGVIWYQGASDAAETRAPMYAKSFPALIQDWRSHWHQGNFPFLYVQISSFEAAPGEDWAMIREAQRRTLWVANTAMAVTIDIGEPHQIHPPDKQDVGKRLALAARALAYGENVEYSGPLFRQTSTEGSKIRVWFDHTDGGLSAKGGPVEGFAVAGADHHFVPATAHIDGETVVVSSPAVPNPKYVRYGWANDPKVNLFNGAGLPASPFTSERVMPDGRF